MTNALSVASDSPKAAWREVLTRHEIDQLLERNALRTWGALALNWGLIGVAFAVVAVAPNPLSIVIAIFLIGGRQLGLAILMHEAAHRILFRSRRWNDGVGNWLCAYPVWGDLYPYRAYHLQHHAKTGTAEDPDLGLAAPFPVTRSSLWRKVWRDLSGQTGWKRAKATWKRDLGLSRGRALRKEGAGVTALHGVVLTNLVLLAILTWAGYPLLYLLWVVAWLTTYSLVMRIRSIAEHGMVPDNADPLRNTRTTLTRWWERLFIAPNRVNYHLEHHLLMTVPHYNLPRLHRLLRKRGALDDACVSRGYLGVLSLASSRQDESGDASAPDALATRPPF
jgi:fatty acid desaturase